MSEYDDESVWLPDPKVAKRFGVSLMALYRWDKADIGFPPPSKINGKNYRHVPALKQWDMELRRKGLADALAKKEDVA